MSYFDPNAEARMNGYALGRIDGDRDGEKKGFQLGQQRGYEEGRADGYTTGWNAAIEVANKEIIKQKEFTSQHSANSHRFQVLAEEGKNVVELLRSELNLATANQELLRLANGDLRQREVGRIQQLNRCMVFISLAVNVLDQLLSNASASHAQEIRTLFTTLYVENVNAALSEG
jgi:hypothetical protein